MRTAGFVLAGGRSVRMGSDKALLRAGDEVLVQQVARAVAAAAGTATVVGDPARYGHLVPHCIADLDPGFGPLSGIETALAASPADWNLICACDMPGLDAGFLRRLLDFSITGQHSCAASADPNGSLHPLCAVYHRGCLPFVKRAMRDGELALMRLLARLEAVPFPSPNPLPNCNTPEEWAAARI
jgi:molybdopterin-guanine dinucleotide biosynthesis protein A